VHVDADRDAAEKALERPGGGWLSGEDAFRALRAYGIRCAPFQSADGVDAAVAAASRVAGLGERVALKLDGPDFLHKSDVGGVALGLSDPVAVRAAAQRLEENARRAAPGKPFRFLVQRMAAPGVELVIGARTDPVFGPLLGVGLGGIHVEVLKDIRFGLVPLTPITARRLITRLRAYPILTGHRGAPPVDLDAIVDALLRLSALVEAHPSILEVEMNPVIARPDGVEAVDARLKVGARP
jgi:acyl-CoA synthetase (NDP forming)